LRLSLQASWTTLVAAELVGALYGLGRILNVAQQDIYPGMIFVGMASVAIFGWSTTWILAQFERYSLSWVQMARAD
jgi:taurine transport system permease protein